MSEILTERSGNILRVTVNRPEKKNAMTSAMYNALADAFNDAATAESIEDPDGEDTDAVDAEDEYQAESA